VKKRNLIAVVAMFSIFLFGIGIAQAVTGIEDAVPGSDIIIPMICEGHHDPGGSDVPVFGSMNTIWAIAEFDDFWGGYGDCTADTSVCNPRTKDPFDASGIGVLRHNVFVNDRFSIPRLDTTECWSKHDVISDNCQNMISQMNHIEQEDMELVIAGKTYFVGYVHYSPAASCNTDWESTDDRLMAWMILNDATKGFSTGMNGISIEDGTYAGFPNSGLAEDYDVSVAASQLFPRFFILNNDAETFNWWILLLGRNAYNFGVLNTFDRSLVCFVCDEHENCVSRPPIAIPDELNIINVNDVLPGGIFPTYPKVGFAYCDIVEHGFLPTQSAETWIYGTLSFTDDPFGDPTGDPETYSVFAYAYQRGVTLGVPAQKLSIINTIHRWNCSPYFGPDLSGISGDIPPRFNAPDDTSGTCCINGPVPGSDPLNIATWAACL
jgi:hypothetical protein